MGQLSNRRTITGKSELQLLELEFVKRVDSVYLFWLESGQWFPVTLQALI